MTKTALITGASVGIGHELARQFARGGYNVILVARNEDKLKTVTQEMRTLGIQADYIAIDLAKPEAPLPLFADVPNRDLSIDVRVNKAGFGALCKFHGFDPQRQ